MGIKRTSRKRHRGVKLVALGLILAGILMLADMRIRPIIEKTATYQSKVLATRIINDAVYSQLDDELFSYDSLVNVVYGTDNSISSIESNMVNINKLKARIAKSVNEQLSTISEHDLSISLGTISGFYAFYNQGPLIPIKVQPEGYVETNLISSFESAGINQTLHRIIVEIKVDISAIIPGYTTSAEVATQFVVAETVIIGTVPESYTHVISGSEDLISKINDYEAG